MQSSKHRDRTIMMMRETNHTFREIGNALGISPQRAHRIVKRIKRQNPTSGIEKVS